jgi:hypothetical protein
MNSHATLNNAISYASAGNTKRAVQLTKEILARDAQNDRAWVLLADLTDDHALAVKSLEKALQINPKNEQVCRKLAATVSKTKCQEVLGISQEEFQNFLGVENMVPAFNAALARRSLRQKSSTPRVNFSLFLVFMALAGFLYLVRPDIQRVLGEGQNPQLASAQGAGTVYQVQEERASQAAAVNTSGAAPAGSRPTDVYSQQPDIQTAVIAYPRFSTFFEQLDRSGACLLDIPLR